MICTTCKSVFYHHTYILVHHSTLQVRHTLILHTIHHQLFKLSTNILVFNLSQRVPPPSRSTISSQIPFIFFPNHAFPQLSVQFLSLSVIQRKVSLSCPTYPFLRNNLIISEFCREENRCIFCSF